VPPPNLAREGPRYRASVCAPQPLTPRHVVVRVRRVDAVEADHLLVVLRALARRSKASWGYELPFLEAFDALLPSQLVRPGRVTLVAEAEGTVAGFAVVDDLGDRAWLEDLWVEPELFGRGAGTSLLEAALIVARALGRPYLEFESDPHAEGFYQRRGAHRFATRRSTLAEGRELPLMRIALEGPPREAGPPRPWTGLSVEPS
jgi:GNAT superfamily N-acetyltransferase